MAREIGRVVKSNSHVDYVVQVFADGEVADPPRPEDHAFGQFVRIPATDSTDLIGIIYDTLLLNPEYGALGPRLSPENELRVFSPDYLNEKATLVGVIAVGTMARSEVPAVFDQGTPSVAATVDAPVALLDEVTFQAFHRPSDALRVAYFPRLLAQPTPILPDLLCGILDRLASAFPDRSGSLAVVRKNIQWRAAIPQA